MLTRIPPDPRYRGADPWYDVTNPAYGAKGDGVADDTAAIQAAFNAVLSSSAGQGQVFFPPGNYVISSTISVGPLATVGATLPISVTASRATLTYTGGSGPVFLLKGIKGCKWAGIYLTAQANAAAGIVAFDLLTDASWQSESGIIFEGCQVVFGNGGQCIAWRARQSGGSGDISDMKWDSCTVTCQASSNGDIGFQSLTANALPWTFLNCSVSHAWRGLSNITPRALLGVDMGNADTSCTVDKTSGFPATGTLLVQSEQITYTGKTLTTFTGLGRGANGTTAATHTHGNLVFSFPNTTGSNSLYWYGGGNGSCQVDFELAVAGSYGIYGGRFELGATLVSCFPYGGTASSATVAIKGTQLSGYDSTQTLIYLGGSVHLSCDCVEFRPAAGQWGNTMIVENSSNNFGSIHLIDSEIQATDPPYSLTHPTNGWQIDVQNCAALNTSGTATAYFARRPVPTSVTALTYSATMTPNPNLGGYQQINVTNASAMTINVPQAQIPGTVLAFEITNSSGGAMGTITWAAGYVLTGGAFSNPANTLRRLIRFQLNGTSWIEIGRAANDF